MTFDEYQQAALKTALRSGNLTLDVCHWVLGLSGESGEVAEKMKKIIRDKQGDVEQLDVADIRKELGDILWYVAVLADELGIKFDEVGKTNIDKLASRQKRGVIGGSGDDR